jgi:uncharacterized membrane protein
MEKKYILIFIVSIILAFLVGFFINNFIGSFTGRVVQDSLNNYSHTKAICNSDKECIDVLITCENGKVIRIEPVSDIIKHDINWTDFREEKELCG